MENEKEKHNGDDRYDVFISYAHVDNKVSKGKGWVTLLHDALKIRLDMLLGEESKIWRDEELQGSDKLTDRIKEALERTNVLISVLTPRYTKSEWCNNELQYFLQTNINEKKLENFHKFNVCKVIKTPVDDEPQAMKQLDLLGFPFVKADTTPPKELFPGWGEEADQEAIKKINDLAYEIKILLKIIKESSGDDQTQSKGSVYLADTSQDVLENRNEIRRELEAQGYTVLPRGDLPRSFSEIQDQVQCHLSQSICSIHLIGKCYGFIPEMDVPQRSEEGNISAVELQVELAAKYKNNNPDFYQLIWLSGDKEFSPPQEKFRKKIDSMELGPNDEMLDKSLHDFKEEIIDKLNATLQKQAGRAKSVSKPKVYLLYSKEDRVDAKEIKQFLRVNGCERLKPVFNAKDQKEVEILHRKRLAEADGVILFWGQADEAWFESNRDDIRSTEGNRQLSTCVIISSPMNDEKEEFIEDYEESASYTICDLSEGFQPSRVLNWLSALIQPGEGNQNHE